MDEFLKIVGMNHMSNNKGFNDVMNYHTDNIKDGLSEVMSQKLFTEFESGFDDEIVELTEFAFVEGMKVAIAILEKKYNPII